MTVADVRIPLPSRPITARAQARLAQIIVATLATATIAGAAALGDGAASAGRSEWLAFPPVKGGSVQKVAHDVAPGAPIVPKGASGGPTG